MDWADLSRVLVKQIGRHNSPLSLTIQFNSQTLGNAVFGNLELNCWRYLEDVIEKQAPGVIEGSPPRLHVPLHDKTGAVIPEPNG